MCGIWGSLSYHPQPVDEPLAGRLNALIARRGPDGAGLWSDGQHCALGFRRLAILDLSPAGSQPMRTSDGRFTLVINGEIYNFRELRAELEQRGVRFRSSGDSEVALQALACWGKAALQRFNGMFALGFYDSLEKRLLLARDHAGIKPLYTLLRPQGLVFASQYDQILAHPWSQGLPFAPDALAHYLRLGYIPAPYALHEDCAMLEAGAWLEVDAGGGIRRGRHFEFPVNPQPDLSGAEASEAVDAAVSAAVARQMVSDVPVGAFLSGGVDSPLVTAKMRAASSQLVTAFTIGLAGDPLDETADALQYARELGIEHILRQAAPADALHLLDDVIAACGEPFADYSIFPTLMVSQLARQRVTVMLSGDGGDELFWGYPGRFGSVLKQAHFFRYPRRARSLYWHAQKFLPNAHNLWSMQYFETIGGWYQGSHTHLSEGWARQIFPGLPAMPQASPLFDYTGYAQDTTANWLRWNEFSGHLSMVLLKVDRASMYHSLEVRVPLLDKEVIQTACRVDWRSCLNLQTGEGKIPLRSSLRRHVQHQSKMKMGFSVPMNAWLRGPLRELLEEKVLRQPGLFGLEYNQPALRQYIQDHQQSRTDNAWGLWILLSASLWQEKYLASHENLR